MGTFTSYKLASSLRFKQVASVLLSTLIIFMVMCVELCSLSSAVLYVEYLQLSSL